ncbi:LysR family transcriptional regulator [Nocardia otitidiscaviarum]|uniref:LysR family transcriptional regulator n=1 Tax=Nocardia otitidiscaviarum TaxID=1823 RepID=A0A516NQX0_9NOCA|nr:LysR substrate-binding domain-containing protein [Nocardia otitidiscaviarum]MCP9620454.1 LysR substrate-binding domain-containing protein [Nocardia otitidiscaviarum]QDP81291.1 LysR family transcriptional regulator [Nocardia otitidiscaviarum]
MSLPPGMPDLEVLDLLASVGELGSLGAAARRHGITQPAASMRISALERRLRLRLLDRGPTGSALTEPGRAVVDYARPILAAAHTFAAGVAALRAADRPRLRIAASKTIADHRMSHWLTALREARPEVAVALEVGNSRQVEAWVRAGQADLGFVEGPHPPAELGSRVLGADDLVVVVGIAHPWARERVPVTARELAGTALLWREPGSGTRDTLWEILGAQTEPAPPAAELGSAAAILATARTGVAPAVLSRLIADADLRSGALVEIPLTDAVLTRKFRAVWRKQSPPADPADVLIRCAERFEQRRAAD